jgi:D-sedoheptulose 7-phosphate isomerase
MKYIKASLEESAMAIANILRDDETLRNLEKAGEMLVQSLANEGTIFSCGNGGSMCDAMHFAQELSGRFRRDRHGLPAIAISDPTHITSVANDYGYRCIFSRFLESHGKPGDVLLALSTSGESQNIMEGAIAARKKDMGVISLTGVKHSSLAKLSDYDICTPGGKYADSVQELHIKMIHILVETVERKFFPENY